LVLLSLLVLVLSAACSGGAGEGGVDSAVDAVGGADLPLDSVGPGADTDAVPSGDLLQDTQGGQDTDVAAAMDAAGDADAAPDAPPDTDLDTAAPDTLPDLVGQDTVAPFCGDGKVTADEDCDDQQDGDDADGCTDQCRFTCNDAAIDCADPEGNCKAASCVANDAGQVCKISNDPWDSPEAPSACIRSYCNNGSPAEANQPDGIACDLFMNHLGDYCVGGQCQAPECGDGVRGPLEACDDGDDINTNGCSNDCEFENCGNSEDDPGEDCDDGANGDDSDGCTDLCRFGCANPLMDCVNIPKDCHFPMCLPATYGFVCFQVGDLEDLPDDGNICTTDTCTEQGISHKPVTNGAPCDNGSGASGDYCYQGNCRDQTCNDGVKGRDEACDDGNDNQCDGCLKNCTLHNNSCGDAFKCGTEQCDDGNDNQCDGCLKNCTLHNNSCGDSFKCGTEQCDDGNTWPCDGCDQGCNTEVASPCPACMVKVSANPGKGIAKDFCLDRYEAARPDATSTNEGQNGSRTVSRAGVLPWYVNPMSAANLAVFQAACAATGKRLCSADEWGLGCGGDTGTVYTYGDTFDPDICNSDSAFCAQHCADKGIPPETCNTAVGCGFTYGSNKIVPTGSLPDCQDQYGAFDVNGNVWEAIPVDSAVDARGYVIKGGAFNCGNAPLRFRCDFNATWNELYAGFRCCKDL
jgi:cysteine-rich repeat protein